MTFQIPTQFRSAAHFGLFYHLTDRILLLPDEVAACIEITWQLDDYPVQQGFAPERGEFGWHSYLGHKWVRQTLIPPDQVSFVEV